MYTYHYFVSNYTVACFGEGVPPFYQGKDNFSTLGCSSLEEMIYSSQINKYLCFLSFMWQICGQIPQTLVSQTSDITELAAELSTSFFLETYIHAKEKVSVTLKVVFLFFFFFY